MPSRLQFMPSGAFYKFSGIQGQRTGVSQGRKYQGLCFLITACIFKEVFIVLLRKKWGLYIHSHLVLCLGFFFPPVVSLFSYWWRCPPFQSTVLPAYSPWSCSYCINDTRWNLCSHMQDHVPQGRFRSRLSQSVAHGQPRTEPHDTFSGSAQLSSSNQEHTLGIPARLLSAFLTQSPRAFISGTKPGCLAPCVDQW